MNTLIDSITNWNSRAIGLVVFGLIILGNFINLWNYFICVIAVTAVISFIRYFHDRKWLKDAEKYVRRSEKRPLWRQALEIAWTVGLTFILIKFGDFFDAHFHEKTTISFLIIFVPLYFDTYFQKFVDSVKSFEEGIQLPGRNQELIPWKEIYTFTLEDELFISSSMGEHNFLIHKEDPEHANKMIADWKERSGKRN